MPTLHDPDWSKLKLSDFPLFKCLCELCECGCFERSHKPHTQTCNKKVTQISNVFESDFVNKAPFEKNSIYFDTYKSFQYETARSKTQHGSRPSSAFPQSQTIIVNSW